MFDAQCDLAALVFDPGEDPDSVLREFAASSNANGFRAVGLVQIGRHYVDVPNISAMLLHDGSELALLQDVGSRSPGRRLKVSRLLNAGARVARALDDGADILIINRFGREECEGRGLRYLIERAIDADIPVVIAVPRHRFTDWIKFAEGMSVKLRCDRDALDGWWHGVSRRHAVPIQQRAPTVCEVFK